MFKISVFVFSIGTVQSRAPFWEHFELRWSSSWYDRRFFFNPFFDNDGFNNGGDAEVDDTAGLKISTSQTTTCDQQVNQAASATG